ncbi:MAG TPA: GIY-YIG nuclease family protein [Candidatus Deferrimicrobium sp.]|nr:GIY-YIG nuclease family protein [Candidatus Deferrimicrobium sp.]
MADSEHFAYLLKCANGSYYAGYTNDLQRRLATHQAGKASKYTRARLPVEMVYWQTFATKGEAMSAEARLKTLTHSQKENLVQGFNQILC